MPRTCTRSAAGRPASSASCSPDLRRIVVQDARPAVQDARHRARVLQGEGREDTRPALVPPGICGLAAAPLQCLNRCLLPTSHPGGTPMRRIPLLLACLLAPLAALLAFYRP